jgi:predicted nucleic acid-binding protein
MRLGYTAGQQFLQRVRSSSLTRRVFVSEAWETQAESLLAQFTDQAFSYVDATSFVVMQRLQLKAAFAFDHHFVVAGFALVSEM